MSYLLCKKCKGKKRIEGIGYLKRDCHECGGTGIVDKPQEIKYEPPLDPLPDIEPVLEVIPKVSKRKEKIIKSDV